MNFRRNIELEADASDRAMRFGEPYITSVNAEEEYVVLYNPRDEYFNLDGYSIADGKQNHTFRFPSRCRIPPQTEYYIYCQPGGPEFNHGTLFEYHVLWTNVDGTLRKMEVLNNDKCSVKLLGPDRRTLSVCEAHLDNPLTAGRCIMYHNNRHNYTY
jgi:hypothetical protein